MECRVVIDNDQYYECENMHEAYKVLLVNGLFDRAVNMERVKYAVQKGLMTHGRVSLANRAGVRAVIF